MRLVHELEEFVDDRLQEFPMCFEEPWILPNDIHDIGCDNSLIILSAFDFAQSKEVLNDGN
jgi:hypothetical protein